MSHISKMLKSSLLIFGMALSTAASALTITTAVDSHAGPWVVTPVLNAAYSYGTDGAIAPTSVGGFSFAVGGSFSFTATGTAAAFGGGTMYGPDGDPTYVANDFGGSSGNGFPSRWVDDVQYPAYLAALIGTFADAAGAIVGTPFVVGSSYTAIAPAGATQILLGLNDDIFGDNAGFFSVTITGPNVGAVPEPATWAMLIGGFGVAGGALRRRAALLPARG